MPCSSSYSNSTRKVPLLCPFYRWANWSLELEEQTISDPTGKVGLSWSKSSNGHPASPRRPWVLQLLQGQPSQVWVCVCVCMCVCACIYNVHFAVLLLQHFHLRLTKSAAERGHSWALPSAASTLGAQGSTGLFPHPGRGSKVKVEEGKSEAWTLTCPLTTE